MVKNDFESWCKKKNRQDLFDEWDTDLNDKNIITTTKSSCEYNSPLTAWWKCEQGHKYKLNIAARTIFNLKCPICYPDNKLLPIGTKYGCLTIIDNSNNNYKCKCKCGKIHNLDIFKFLEKRHKYCGYDCNLRKNILDTYERIYDETYNIHLENTRHETLEIIECVDENYEELFGYYDKRKKNGGTFKIYKKYKCQCYLCGKEYVFKSSDFLIKKESYRYYSVAHCNCHEISSFQWRTMDVLNKHNILYRVEVFFDDLKGVTNIMPLRFDFVIYDSNEKPKYFIECQGKQHYESVEEFGGDLAFERQKKHDELKRNYAKNKGIPLYEIPYTCNTYEKEEKFLKKLGII